MQTQLQMPMNQIQMQMHPPQGNEIQVQVHIPHLPLYLQRHLTTDWQPTNTYVTVTVAVFNRSNDSGEDDADASEIIKTRKRGVLY